MTTAAEHHQRILNLIDARTNTARQKYLKSGRRGNAMREYVIYMLLRNELAHHAPTPPPTPLKKARKMDTKAPKQHRGFATMTPERRKEIAAKGGASVPHEKRAFSVDRKLAAEAGRKGGEAAGGYRK